MKKAVLGIAMLAALGSSVGTASAVSFQAVSPNTWYVPIMVGALKPDGQGLGGGFFVGSGVGYNLSQYVALQGIFGLSSHDDKNTASSSTNSFVLLGEGRFSVPTGTRLSPHVMIGAGDLKLRQNNAAGDIGIGFSYYLTHHLSIGADYRAIHVFHNAQWNSLFTGGMQLTFGGNAVGPNYSSVGQPLTAKQKAMLKRSQHPLHGVLPQGVHPCTGFTPGNESGCVTFDGDKMIMHLNVKFRQNLANIRPQYGDQISRVGNFMNSYKSTNVSLYGYASSEGPLSFNQKLSQRRANAVEKYLVRQSNISSSRIQAIGMGISNPEASNATAAGRAMNRRVEAQIVVPAKLVN